MTLEDAQIVCDRVNYRMGRSASTGTPETRYTDVWLTNDAETVAVFASFSGRLNCDDIRERSLTGFVKTVGNTLPRTASPLLFGGQVDMLEFCGYCGSINNQLMVGVFIFLIGLGALSLYAGLTRPVAPAVSPPDDPSIA